MAEKGTIHVGTSGWHYDHWRGPFYPEKTRPEDFLAYYSERLHTAEINNSFYQLPSEQTFEEWRKIVPGGFVFAVKASRYITHMKKLKDPEGPVGNFMERVAALKRKLGPVLFQLPPRWRRNPERLSAFLEALPKGHRYAFEMRDSSWFHDSTYEALEAHGAAFCIYELAGRLSPRRVTAPFAYVRLHGPGEAYEGNYTDKALSGWAEACRDWAAEGLDVYFYFDNDQAGYAAKNALRLQEMTA